MNRPFRRLIGAALVAGLVALPATVFTQTALNNPTLSAAMSATDTIAQVSSATGITVPGTGTNLVLLLIDKELMAVRTVSGTVIGVTRGLNGTRQYAHVSGAQVWVAPPAAIVNYFLSGQCQRNTLLYVPQVLGGTPGAGSDVGALFDCLGVGAAGQWVQTSPTLGLTVRGSIVASAASITPTGTYFPVSGTTTINTIVVPAGWAGGLCLTLEPTGAWSTGTTGNIGIATSPAVVGKALLECWNDNTSKWQPSY